MDLKGFKELRAKGLDKASPKEIKEAVVLMDETAGTFINFFQELSQIAMDKGVDPDTLFPSHVISKNRKKQYAAIEKSSKEILQDTLKPSTQLSFDFGTLGNTGFLKESVKKEFNEEETIEALKKAGLYDDYVIQTEKVDRVKLLNALKRGYLPASVSSTIHDSASVAFSVKEVGL